MSMREHIADHVKTFGWWIIAEVLMAPFQILALFVVRIIRPVLLVQIRHIVVKHIGHMAGNTDLALTEIWLQGREFGADTKVIWVLSHRRVCNKFLLRLIKRRITVFPRWAIMVALQLNKLIPGGDRHDLGIGTDRDVKNLLDRTNPQLSFTTKEISRGFATLTKLGLPVDAKFVLLIVRDSAYNSSLYPANDWSFHDYRDCSIENSVVAAEELTRRGYYVFRMGAVVKYPLNTSNPMIIDYASNGMRSDFMDIFLGANCEFCISHGAGFDAVPFVFRRPILYVNIVPIGSLATYSEKFLLQTKTLVWTETGARLTLREIFEAHLYWASRSSDYLKAGVSLVENTPQENLDAVIEMVDRVEGKWIETPAAIALQQKFWAAYASCMRPEERALHGEFRAHYVSSALEKDPGWLD